MKIGEEIINGRISVGFPLRHEELNGFVEERLVAGQLYDADVAANLRARLLVADRAESFVDFSNHMRPAHDATEAGAERCLKAVGNSMGAVSDENGRLELALEDGSGATRDRLENKFKVVSVLGERDGDAERIVLLVGVGGTDHEHRIALPE